MQTSLSKIKSIVEQKIIDAGNNKTAHWLGVQTGLNEILADITAELENEKKHLYSAYVDGILDADVILSDDTQTAEDIENIKIAEYWFDKKYITLKPNERINEKGYIVTDLTKSQPLFVGELTENEINKPRFSYAQISSLIVALGQIREGFSTAKSTFKKPLNLENTKTLAENALTEFEQKRKTQ